MNPVRVKICGLTNLQDAQVAVDAGADLLGFICYPPSPRFVPAACIAQILLQLLRRPVDWEGSAPPGPALRTVGVFVNADADSVAETMAITGLDYAQLHGGEPPVVLERLAGRAFKALRPSSEAEAQADAEWYADLGPSDGPQLLVDAYDPHAYGGTGKVADWSVAAGLARLYPRLVLAGGLTPGNVTQAIRRVRPWGVDVGSGVEREPGHKDHDRVRAFVAAARQASL